MISDRRPMTAWVGGKWPEPILLWDAKIRQWLAYKENN